MSTTDETKAQGDGAGEGPPPKRQPGWVKPAKRYGPIVVVLALIGAAVLVFGGGNDDGDDEAATDGATASEEELISSGPMTWQKAEQEGETANIDWGPNCDTETGKIKLVSVYAPPCVEPFEGDNGGATSPGVTADTVKVVEYIADPALDPLDRRDRLRRRCGCQRGDRRRDGRGIRRPLQPAVRDVRPPGRGRDLYRHWGGRRPGGGPGRRHRHRREGTLHRDRWSATVQPRSSQPSWRHGASSAPVPVPPRYRNRSSTSTRHTSGRTGRHPTRRRRWRPR